MSTMSASEIETTLNRIHQQPGVMGIIIAENEVLF
jgi:hypothetical protein